MSTQPRGRGGRPGNDSDRADQGPARVRLYGIVELAGFLLVLTAMVVVPFEG